MKNVYNNKNGKNKCAQDVTATRIKIIWTTQFVNLFQFQRKRGDASEDSLAMTFSMSELNRTTKLLIETDEEDPDAAPQKSAKEIEEEKKAEKDAQQKMVSLQFHIFQTHICTSRYAQH